MFPSFKYLFSQLLSLFGPAELLSIIFQMETLSTFKEGREEDDTSLFLKCCLVARDQFHPYKRTLWLVGPLKYNDKLLCPQCAQLCDLQTEKKSGFTSLHFGRGHIWAKAVSLTRDLVFITRPAFKCKRQVQELTSQSGSGSRLKFEILEIFGSTAPLWLLLWSAYNMGSSSHQLLQTNRESQFQNGFFGSVLWLKLLHSAFVFYKLIVPFKYFWNLIISKILRKILHNSIKYTIM